MNLSKNIVIEASAGTGKTYTLVQTILQALFQKNLPMEALVALTFTKKAAGEMKERIAAELQKIDTAEKMEESWRAWGHPLDVLQKRAREALETIDRAAIGTIHSYAFSLLKRFPLAAGISPDAEVDEKGVRTDDLFEQEWPRWLSSELRIQNAESGWLNVLERLQLPQIKDLARRLCDFDIPLRALPLTNDSLKKDLEPFYQDVCTLLAGKPETVKSTRIAQACEEVLGRTRLTPSPSPDRRGEHSLNNPLPSGEGGRRPGEASFPAEIIAALEEVPSTTKDWSDEEVKRLKIIRRIALNLLAQGDQTLTILTGLLKPFVQNFRGKLLAEGLLSNNALLVLSRNLVVKDLNVRQTLKKQIRLIFIDEFQDTDPLQGELLLFLAEIVTGQAKTWDTVKLEPGKLFIVGDPKQSIYLFRGADIGAYARITQMVLDQGGERLLLEESYRSHEQIIHAVNAAFAPLIQEKPPVSPAYQALIPRRNSEDAERHLVELRLAYSQEACKSEDSLGKEAVDAASWIFANVSPSPLMGEGGDGGEVPPTSVLPHHPSSASKEDGLASINEGSRGKGGGSLRYKDIALIFRSTTAMSPFIEQLRALNIPFVVEGERYFYRTPEVTDVLNLLRVLDDPENRLGLAGFLRSPLGGFNDAELALLQRKNGLLLAKALPEELDGPAHHGAWELLRRLQKRVGREPLKSILHHVYEDTYLLELAARSYHRDQTIANLNKLRRLMELFAEEGETTLHGLLTKIDRFMEADRLEGESPLADETYDAVRLLTIHAAKGLEFPVVWLPGLHRDAGGNLDTTRVTARYDWATGGLGIAVGKQARNIGDFILEKDYAVREEAEEARVLYVAMTRARDHLILSGGVCSTGRSKQPASGSFLAQLAAAWKIDLENVPEGELQLGQGIMTVRKSSPVALAKGGKPANEWLKTLDPARIAAVWKNREKTYELAMSTKAVQTPTSAGENQWSANTKDPEALEHPEPKSIITPNMLGTLVHRFLEQWDFNCEKCSMPAKLRQVANSYFAGLGFLKEPFPDPKVGDKTKNPQDLAKAVADAQDILAEFIGSDAEAEIKSSQILGREVPFFYMTDRRGDGETGRREDKKAFSPALPLTPSPHQSLMRGYIDILYRTTAGQLVIGDYKTDKEHDEARYIEQAKAYQYAIELSLSEKAVFKLIYLRDMALS
jgi:ATP-dependent helicase/nuclease subunit A